MAKPDQIQDLLKLDWSDLQAAHLVGEMQTLTRAAKRLGVHRSTLMRQITSLESSLGLKVFDRSLKGYTLTPFGKELINLTGKAAKRFEQLVPTKLASTGYHSSVLKIAASPELTSLFNAALPELRNKFPELWFSFITRHDQASIPPQDVDIVLSVGDSPTTKYPAVCLSQIQQSLFASRAYLNELDHSLEKIDCTQHRFVHRFASENSTRIDAWVNENVSTENIVFRSNSNLAAYSAIESGIGVGACLVPIALEGKGLVQVCDPRDEWKTSIWLSYKKAPDRDPRTRAIISALQKRLSP